MTNSTLRVIPVTTSRLHRQFINLPQKIYKNDSLWVPPLWLIEKMDYKKGANPVLDRSEHILFLAFRGKEAVGRIIAYIDPHYNAYHNKTTGFFGSFESFDDEKIGSALYKTVEDWLRERDMSEIMGPINPIAESWGFLLNGPGSPIYMSPYNPLYYNTQIEVAGFTKAKDLLVYEADAGAGYTIPERFTKYADHILIRKPQITVRSINLKDLDKDASNILKILNESVSGNWGFVPVKEKEMKEIVNKLKLIIDRDAIWFVEMNGEAVGVALGFPDINQIFKKIDGRLSPRGIYSLLTDRKKIKDYRLWGLAVMPEYHGLGLDVLLYVNLYRALEPKGIRLEANYMLEDNLKILNALEKMNLKQIKKYRVYEKKIGKSITN